MRFPLSIRFPPLLGESLLSYVLRLCQANGIQLLDFLNSVRKSKSLYAQKADYALIDLSPNNLFDIESLLDMTRISKEMLLGTTMYYLVKYFHKNSSVGSARVLSGLISGYFRYCPACLKEKLYGQLIWRFTCIDMCLVHGVVLQGSCIHCKDVIKYNDIFLPGYCPTCLKPLSAARIYDTEISISTEERWVHKLLAFLLAPSTVDTYNNDLAMRLLYFLNNQSPLFQRQIVASNMKNPKILNTLLQHARGSLSQKRTLHLSTFLTELKDRQVSPYSFWNISIPQAFIDSVHFKPPKMSHELACIAPWCENYNLPGSLYETGSNSKRLLDGTRLRHYMACLSCGCEYAINENGKLEERTYFISAYSSIKKDVLIGVNLRYLAKKSGFTVDKLQRAIAYFSSRLPSLALAESFVVDTGLLKKFSEAVRGGETINSIKRWDCWTSYKEFLRYRYDISVMSTVIQLRRPRGPQADGEEKRNKIMSVINEMYDNDTDITLNSVAAVAGVSVGTIKYRDCTDYLANKKQKQNEDRLAQRKEQILQSAQSYFEDVGTEKVLSSELYYQIGISRNILWRKDPQMTSYITRQLLQHNKDV